MAAGNDMDAEEWPDLGVAPEGWLDIDEFDDVRASLLILRDCLGHLTSNPLYWKWAILAAHSALQGACVCILTRTDGLGALTDRSSEEMRKKLYGEAGNRRNLDDPNCRWPDSRVESLPGLLVRLPDGLRVKLPDAKAEYGFDLPGDLQRLHQFRNRLTHFESTGWSIEMDGLPRIVRRAFDLTSSIIRDGRYQRRSRFPDMNLEPLLLQIDDELRRIEDTKSGS